MLKDSQTTLDDAVLQNRSWGNVNGAALRGNNDDGSLKGDVAAEVYRTGNSEVVQLDDAGNAGNALLEVRDLLEVGAELNDGEQGRSGWGP